MWVDRSFVTQIYTTFYCRQNEPSYIKSLKLDILAAIADETNAFDIATELTEYVNDIDEQLARDAVKAVGRIAIEVSNFDKSTFPHASTPWAAPEVMEVNMLKDQQCHWPSDGPNLTV